MRDPRLRWSVLFALAIVAVSCKGDTSKQADPASAAGDVREVTGEVTGTHAGVARALAVGDAVAAGERVTTGHDGDVVIELRHNHVRWHLGPDQDKTPMEAAAWSAPPPAAGTVSGDRTAVAGRHAERSAAQTTAGAVANVDGVGVGSGSGSSAGSGAGSGTGRGSARPKHEKKDPPEPKPDVARKDPTSSGGGGCDEVACMIDATAPCCAKYKKGGGTNTVEPVGGAELPETIGRDEILAGIDPVKDRFIACGEKYPEAPNQVKLKIKVSASGSVKSVSVADEIDEGLASCLESAAKAAKFAVTQNGGTFTFPAVLR